MRFSNWVSFAAQRTDASCTSACSWRHSLSLIAACEQKCEINWSCIFFCWHMCVWAWEWELSVSMCVCACACSCANISYREVSVRIYLRTSLRQIQSRGSIRCGEVNRPTRSPAARKIELSCGINRKRSSVSLAKKKKSLTRKGAI